MHHTQAKMGKWLLLTLSLFALSSTLQAQTGEAIYQSHLRAINQAKASSMQQLSATGTAEMLGIKMPLAIYYKRSEKVRMEMEMMGYRSITVYNNHKAFMTMPGMPVTDVDEKDIGLMSTTTSFDDLLFQAVAKKAKITYAGKEQLPSGMAFKLLFVHPDNDTVIGYIDTRTYYLVKRQHSKMQEGKMVVVNELYSNFKATDGVVMAWKQQVMVDSLEIASLTFTNMDFSTALNDELFDKPNSDPVKADKLPVDEILRRHFAAINQDKINRTQQQTITCVATVEDMEIPSVLYVKRPHKYRFEMNVEKFVIVDVFDGDKQYRSMTGKPVREIKPDDHEFATMLVSIEDVLARAKKEEAKITDDGLDKVDGKTAYKLLVTYPTGEKVLCYIDAHTFHFLKEEKKVTKKGKAVNVVIYYEDYRTVDGMVIAFRQSHEEDGKSVGRVLISKIDFNTPIPDAKFAKPTK